jgi:hypothetical protein
MRSGPFFIEEACPLDAPREELLSRIVPVTAAALRSLPSATLTDRGVDDARHGRPVRADDLSSRGAGPHAWVTPGNALVAIGELDAATEHGRVLRGFVP